MDLGEANPMLLARCHRWSSLTLGDFAARAHAFVAELVPVHPLFAGLRLVGERESDSPPLSADLSNLEPWMLERAWDRKAPNNHYSDLGSGGQPTAESKGSLGFKLMLSNLKSWDGKVDIELRFGSTTNTNICNLELPRKDHPEFKDLALCTQLLELVVRHWPVHHASYGLAGWNGLVNWVGEPASRRGNIEINWLTYVDDPSVADVLPPQVKVCRVGSGVLFQLAEHFTSHLSVADVALGQEVRAALAAAGKLQGSPLLQC